MKVYLFEDDGYKKLLPLVYMRPVWDLVCGAQTLKQKIAKYYQIDGFVSSRDYLNFPADIKGPGLFLNGQILADPSVKKQIPLEGLDEEFYSRDGVLIAYRTNAKRFPSTELRASASRNRRTLNIRLITYPWDLIKQFPAELSKEIKPSRKGKVHPKAVLYNAKAIQIAKGAVVEAGAVLDARQGPIYIGEGSLVHPAALLRGPLYLGPHCKVAGEIVASSFMGFDNKGHYGFIGHSYLCEWVNLGAGATNSNLKNNYSNVKVACEGKPVDTGETFMGCFIGDHAKLGIGCLINTGTVIGIFAHVLGGQLTPKSIPSFSWNIREKYELSKALETAKAVMARRGIKLSQSLEQLISNLIKM